MDSSQRQNKSSCADYHSAVSSPVIRVLEVTDKGVIFESREAFEIGSWIQLGFHIQSPVARVPESAFISSEGMVVSSSYCAGENGLPIHEIILLFGDMSEHDKALLRDFTQPRSEVESAGANAIEKDLDPVGLN